MTGLATTLKSCAAPVPTGGACTAANQCASLVCLSKKCAEPKATDLAKNGTETDVDCGGSSGFKSQYNQICSLAADCASNACTSGLCAKASAAGTVRVHDFNGTGRSSQDR